jgi:DNA polymerase III delta prime subunit
MGKIKEFINKNDTLTDDFGIITQGVDYTIDKLSPGTQNNVQITQENYSNNNRIIENCFFVRFFDHDAFKIQLVYSAQYGFLQVKNTQHEINRIL